MKSEKITVEVEPVGSEQIEKKLRSLDKNMNQTRRKGVQFFEESFGVKSMTRLLAFILVMSGIAIGVLGVCLRYEQTAMVAGLFIGSSVTEKVVQKFAEGKSG